MIIFICPGPGLSASRVTRRRKPRVRCPRMIPGQRIRTDRSKSSFYNWPLVNGKIFCGLTSADALCFASTLLFLLGVVTNMFATHWKHPRGWERTLKYSLTVHRRHGNQWPVPWKRHSFASYRPLWNTWEWLISSPSRVQGISFSVAFTDWTFLVGNLNCSRTWEERITWHSNDLYHLAQADP